MKLIWYVPIVVSLSLDLELTQLTVYFYINNESQAGCLSSICVADANIILKSGGQALFSEVMSVFMAATCGCTIPFESCVKLLE